MKQKKKKKGLGGPVVFVIDAKKKKKLRGLVVFVINAKKNKKKTWRASRLCDQCEKKKKNLEGGSSL